MTTAAEFEVLLSLKDQMSSQLSRVLGEVEKQTKALESAFKGAGSSAQSMGGALKSVEGGANSAAGALRSAGQHAQGLGGFLSHAASSAVGFVAGQAIIHGVGAAMGAATGAAIGFNDSIDKVRIGMASMLGSTAAADAMIKDLMTFARSTPFEFEGLAQTSQLLLQVGFAAKDVIPTMTAVGDAVSAAGRGEESVQRVVLALSQMAAKGKISAEELNQMTEAGIAALPILASQMHMTTGAVSDMIEKGLLPADKALKMLIEGMEARAPGAMDKMSHTWTGAVSNIHDSLTQLVAGAFRPFFDVLTAGANRLADFLMTDKVAEFGKQVSLAFDNLAKGMGALFSGDKDAAKGFFANFGFYADQAAAQVKLAFLSIADVLMPALEPIIAWGTSLAAAGLQWGANLIGSFASGMITAAGSILSSALNDIFSYIASWFPSSPAKRGPFSQIYVMGADILNSLFQGMSQADFGALDGVMKSVSDVLNTQLNNQQFGKEGLIPAMVGSEAAVAQALADIHEFGAISEETLSMLGKYLGQDAPLIVELITQFAKINEIDAQLATLNTAIAEFDQQITTAQRNVNAWEQFIRKAERAMGDVERAIAAVDRQIEDLNRAFEAQKRPIQDALDILTRYYDKALKGADDVIASINREIDARRRLRQGEIDRLDTLTRGTALEVANLDLQEAQNAVMERRVRLLEAVQSAERGVTSAQQSLTNAQHSLATLDPKADAFARNQAQQAVTNAQQGLGDAQTRLGQAQQNLATQGVETARDRLNIERARQGVIEAQLRVENTQDEHNRTAATDARADLEWTRDQALRPIQQQLENITGAHEAALRVLEDQKIPLEANLRIQQDAVQALKDAKQPLDDALEVLNDQKQALTDQVAELEAQKKPIEDAIALTQTRLSHERDITDQIKAQLDLMNQIATAGGAGGGGAGKPSIGAGLGAGGLGLPQRPKPGETHATNPGGAGDFGGDPNLQSMDQKIAALGAKVKAQFTKSVKEGFQSGFDSMTGDEKIFAGLGAALGFYLGGPGGAIIGAAVALAIEKGVKTGFKNALTSDIAGDILGGLRAGFDTQWADFEIWLRRKWQEFINLPRTMLGMHSPSTVFKEMGGDIVQGLWDGITDTWEGFIGWFTSPWGDMIATAKTALGGDGPAARFVEIGRDIVQGVWDGITDMWTAFVTWVSKAFTDAIAAVKKLLGIASASTVFHAIGIDIMEGLLNGAVEKWKAVSEWFTALPGETVKAVGNVTATLKGTGMALLTGLWEGMKSVWEGFAGISGWLFSLAAKAIEALKDTGSTLYNSGVSWMEGLWNGLKAKWTEISTWLGQRAQDAANILGNLIPPGLPGSNRKSTTDEGGGASGPIKRPAGGGTLNDILLSTGSYDDYLRWLASTGQNLPPGYQEFLDYMNGASGGSGGSAMPFGPQQPLGPMTPGHSPTGDAQRALQQSIFEAQQSAAAALKSSIDGCKSNPNGSVTIALPSVPGGNTGNETIPCWELLGMNPRELFPGLFTPAPYGSGYPGAPGQGGGNSGGGYGYGGGYGGNSGGGQSPVVNNNFYNHGTIVGPDATGTWINEQLSRVVQRGY